MTASIIGSGVGFFGPGAGPETGTNHNAYNSGYSAWCGNCHGDFHDAVSTALIHPSGELLDQDQVDVYNSYNGTTDCVNNPPGFGTPCGTGTFASGYLHYVPIVDPAITTTTASGATDGTSSVACVSCHRSHATSAMDAGRWDFSVTGLAEDGHESSSYPMPNPFDGFQRSLCNKCHSKDEYDTLVDFTP